MLLTNFASSISDSFAVIRIFPPASFAAFCAAFNAVGSLATDAAISISFGFCLTDCSVNPKNCLPNDCVFQYHNL